MDPRSSPLPSQEVYPTLRRLCLPSLPHPVIQPRSDAWGSREKPRSPLSKEFIPLWSSPGSQWVARAAAACTRSVLSRSCTLHEETHPALYSWSRERVWTLREGRTAGDCPDPSFGTSENRTAHPPSGSRPGGGSSGAALGKRRTGKKALRAASVPLRTPGRSPPASPRCPLWGAPRLLQGGVRQSGGLGELRCCGGKRDWAKQPRNHGRTEPPAPIKTLLSPPPCHLSPWVSFPPLSSGVTPHPADFSLQTLGVPCRAP